MSEEPRKFYVQQTSGRIDCYRTKIIEEALPDEGSLLKRIFLYSLVMSHYPTQTVCSPSYIPLSVAMLVSNPPLSLQLMIVVLATHLQSLNLPSVHCRICYINHASLTIFWVNLLILPTKKTENFDDLAISLPKTKRTDFTKRT